MFRQYADAHRDDGSVDRALLTTLYRARDVLALRVCAPDGSDVPVEWVLIHDFGVEAGEGGHEVEICFASAEALAQCFPDVA